MLSIVIPTKDTRSLTLACLESLHRADGPELEIVVVDDGSSDGTAEAIRGGYPGVRVLRNDRPRLFTDAANRGIAATGGNPVLVLNSDTEVAPGALRELVATFEADPGLGIAGARLRYPDGRPQWSGGAEPGLLWFLVKSSRLAVALARLGAYGRWRRRRETGEVDWVTGAAMAIRREVLDSVGSFDPRYRMYAQDLDLCLAARDAGWRVAVLPRVSVTHHHGATIGSDRPDRVSDRQDLVRIWADLLRWAEKRHGAAWAARARRMALAGTRLRLAALRAGSRLGGRPLPPEVAAPLEHARDWLRGR